MGAAVLFSQELEFKVLECGSCGVAFALSTQFIKQRRRSRENFYCPNGCCRVFTGETEEQRLRKQLEDVERSRKFYERRMRTEMENARTADYRRRAAKAQLTKMRKRVAKGVCPCCNRSFQNLREHMKTQHPGMLEKLEE